MPSNAQTSPETIPASSRPANDRFVVLDGMRGVAAIAVILDHVPHEFVNGFLPGRALSVDFFFVLSGFVLAHSYGQRLSTTLSPAAFLRLRLIRLYPLYLLGLLITLPIIAYYALVGRISAQNIAASVFFAVLFLPKPSFRSGLENSFYPLNGPAWSLLFELIANAVFATTARRLTQRRLKQLLPVGAVLLVLAYFNHPGLAAPGSRWSQGDVALARVMYGFFAGVFIYHLRDTWRAPALPAWLSIAVFLAIVAVPASGLWRSAFDAAAGVMLMPLLVLFSANAVVSGLTARAFTVVGAMSYAVYMLHVPVLGVQSFVLNRIGVALPGVVYIALLFTLTGIAALLANKYYDTPVRRWLMARFVSDGKATTETPVRASGEL